MSLMLAEIQQQPAASSRIVRSESHRICVLLTRSKRRTRLIILVARGSSDNAALFGRYLLEISTGIPVSLAAPPVHIYGRKLDLRDALVIGISNPVKETTSICSENSRKGGAVTVAITNESNSTWRKYPTNLPDSCRRERSVAATKLTGQLMIFHLLASA
jgi:glucosamine--fructose-6-phosphate aminotransferase (isomerizing)